MGVFIFKMIPKPYFSAKINILLIILFVMQYKKILFNFESPYTRFIQQIGAYAQIGYPLFYFFRCLITIIIPIIAKDIPK